MIKYLINLYKIIPISQSYTNIVILYDFRVFLLHRFDALYIELLASAGTCRYTLLTGHISLPCKRVRRYRPSMPYKYYHRYKYHTDIINP